VKKAQNVSPGAGMKGRGLTGLHFIPQGHTLIANYYINNILEKEVASPLPYKCE